MHSQYPHLKDVGNETQPQPNCILNLYTRAHHVPVCPPSWLSRDCYARAARPNLNFCLRVCVHTHMRTHNLMHMQQKSYFQLAGMLMGWIFVRDLDTGDAKAVEQRLILSGIKIELEKQVGEGRLLCSHKRVTV